MTNNFYFFFRFFKALCKNLHKVTFAPLYIHFTYNSFKAAKVTIPFEYTFTFLYILNIGICSFLLSSLSFLSPQNSNETHFRGVDSQILSYLLYSFYAIRKSYENRIKFHYVQIQNKQHFCLYNFRQKTS